VLLEKKIDLTNLTIANRTGCKMKIILVLITMVVVMAGCNSAMKNNKEKNYYLVNKDTGTRYYTWCEFKSKPVVLSGELSESEAKKLQAYYRVQYNAKKLPVILEKYLDGEVVLQHKYIYDQKDCLEKIIYTDESGILHETDKW
jgi:hypothetical protein